MKNKFETYLMESEYNFKFESPKILHAKCFAFDSTAVWTFYKEVNNKIYLDGIKQGKLNGTVINGKINSDQNRLNKFFIEVRKRFGGLEFGQLRNEKDPDWITSIRDAMREANSTPMQVERPSQYHRQINFAESINEAAIDSRGNELKIGDKVIVKKEDDFYNRYIEFYKNGTLLNQTGTIKEFHGTKFSGIEFDNPVILIEKDTLQPPIPGEKNYKYKWWLSTNTLEKIQSKPSKYHRQINFAESINESTQGFNVGDRVIVKIEDDYQKQYKNYFIKGTLLNQTGTIRDFHGEKFAGIEFDNLVVNSIKAMTTIPGEKDYRYKWWLNINTLEKIKRTPSKYHRQINFAE